MPSRGKGNGRGATMESKARHAQAIERLTFDLDDGLLAIHGRRPRGDG